MIVDLFNVKVSVLRIKRTSDGMGGWTEEEEVLHKDLQCRINWLKGSERVMFSKDTWLIDARVYCSIVDIKVTDRISYKGDIFEIVNVSNPDNANKYLTVEMKRIE